MAILPRSAVSADFPATSLHHLTERGLEFRATNTDPCGRKSANVSPHYAVTPPLYRCKDQPGKKSAFHFLVEPAATARQSHLTREYKQKSRGGHL